jgi:hypothetical protein
LQNENKRKKKIEMLVLELIQANPGWTLILFVLVVFIMVILFLSQKAKTKEIKEELLSYEKLVSYYGDCKKAIPIEFVGAILSTKKYRLTDGYLALLRDLIARGLLTEDEHHSLENLISEEDLGSLESFTNSLSCQETSLNNTLKPFEHIFMSPISFFLGDVFSKYGEISEYQDIKKIDRLIKKFSVLTKDMHFRAVWETYYEIRNALKESVLIQVPEGIGLSWRDENLRELCMQLEARLIREMNRKDDPFLKFGPDEKKAADMIRKELKETLMEHGCEDTADSFADYSRKFYVEKFVD